MSDLVVSPEPVRLGPLESQVMGLLWEGHSLTIRQLIDRIPSQPAYTTIATVLKNLRRKRLVCPRKAGHSTYYEACQSREAHTAQLLEHVLNASGDRTASILHFVGSMPETDRALLLTFLQEKESSEPA